MKKLSVLVLTLLLILALGSVTLASTMGIGSTIGIGSKEGAETVTVEYYPKANSYEQGPFFGFDYGYSDQLKLSLGYQFEKDNVAAFKAGARYAFAENLAGTVNLTKGNDVDLIWNIGVRAKYGLSDTIALTGYAEYWSQNEAGIKVLGQGEFTVADNAFATVGLENYSGDIFTGQDGIGFVAGFEYSAIENWTLYLNYEKVDKVKDGQLTLGANYSF